MKEWNERLAAKITSYVSTMACAYIFAAIALIALPQAIGDTFADGAFHALPMVTWLSQAFLQLVLLSIIMVGQDVQGKTSEERAKRQFEAVMETLADVREDHAATKAIVEDVHNMMSQEDAEDAKLKVIIDRLDWIEYDLGKAERNP